MLQNNNVKQRRLGPRVKQKATPLSEAVLHITYYVSVVEFEASTLKVHIDRTRNFGAANYDLRLA